MDLCVCVCVCVRVCVWLALIVGADWTLHPRRLNWGGHCGPDATQL